MIIAQHTTIGDLRNQLTPIFQYIDSQNATLHIRWLLEALFNRPYAYILGHLEKRTLTQTQRQRLNQWIEDYQQHKPIAYILNKTEFMGLDFIVNKEVLIPRSDTEIMVEYLINTIKKQYSLTCSNSSGNKNLRLLELGVGSGAIAISLFKHLSLSGIEVDITATDNRLKALKMAKKNANKHQATIRFKLGDWFSAIDKKEKFDLIISNPPYVSQNVGHHSIHLEKSLSYEPASALYASDDGLSEIKKIIIGYRQHLNRNGLLVIEHGYTQGRAVRELLETTSHQRAQTHRDLAQRERFSVVVAKK